MWSLRAVSLAFFFPPYFFGQSLLYPLFLNLFLFGEHFSDTNPIPSSLLNLRPLFQVASQMYNRWIKFGKFQNETLQFPIKNDFTLIQWPESISQKPHSHSGFFPRLLYSEFLTSVNSSTAMVWMFVSPHPQFISWNPDPKCDAIRRWGFGEVVRSWGWNPQEWD